EPGPRPRDLHDLTPFGAQSVEISPLVLEPALAHDLQSGRVPWRMLARAARRLQLELAEARAREVPGKVACAADQRAVDELHRAAGLLPQSAQRARLRDSRQPLLAPVAQCEHADAGRSAVGQ